jgi:importin subunit alpha-1
MATSVADRMRSFKKGIDIDETRRRREDTTVQIRKSRREERLNQRRRILPVVRLAIHKLYSGVQVGDGC